MTDLDTTSRQAHFADAYFKMRQNTPVARRVWNSLTPFLSSSQEFDVQQKREAQGLAGIRRPEVYRS